MVWLGHSEYSEIALAHMENLLSHARKYVELPLELVSVFADRHSTSRLALRKFLMHPWFRSVWTVQEVAVAKHVHLLWGGRYLDWEFVESIIKLLNTPQMLELITDAVGDVWNIARIIKIRDELRGGNRLPLSDLLFSCSTLQASDPRDKIFALQGISSDGSDPSLVPGYQLVYQQVYQNTARYLLLHQQLDNILPLAGIGRSTCFQDSPSWVPDWNEGSVNSFYSLERRLAYHASRTTRPNTLASESPNTLIFAGYRIDEITATSPIFNFLDARSRAQEKARWEDAAGTLAKNSSKDPYRAGEPLSEALWRTFIGDRTRTERPAPASFERYYQAHRETDKCGFPAFFTNAMQASLNDKGFHC